MISMIAEAIGKLSDEELAKLLKRLEKDSPAARTAAPEVALRRKEGSPNCGKQ